MAKHAVDLQETDEHSRMQGFRFPDEFPSPLHFRTLPHRLRRSSLPEGALRNVFPITSTASHTGRTDSRMTGGPLSPAPPSFPVMIVVHEYSREEIFLGTTHPSPVAFAGRHLPLQGKALREDSSCYLHPRGLRKPFVYNRRAALLICLPL